VLVQRDETQFAILSRLDPVDVDVFSLADMDALEKDLQRLKSRSASPEDLRHIDRLVEMVALCRRIEGATLMFNPFNV
jgi:hypothetical protein